MDEYLDDDFVLATSEEPDPLDAEDFNPVDYINRQFPNKEAFKGLDSFVDQLKGQQRQIDEDIRLAVRRQAVQGRRARADLDEAKAAVGELFERIKAIRAKAEQSEELVSDVCRDIKSLDIAKRNLTLTVTALKRLVMLVTALEQLRALAHERRYEDAAGLIYAVEELAGHFRELSHVSRVADLLERKAGVVGDLRQQLLDDYATILGSPTAGIELPSGWGAAAARCVDALGPSMQREVVTQFCLSVLEDYKNIFQPPSDTSALEMAERRFAWLKRTVKEYRDKHASNFPDAWRVPCSICMHFCHVTRQHLVEILSTSHHTVDPELMIRVLRASMQFENALAREYNVEDPSAATAGRNGGASGFSGSASVAGLGLKYPDVLGKPAKQAAGPSAAENLEDFAPRFHGIISECFDAYLSTWVQHEEKQLLDVLDRSTAPGTDKIVGNAEVEDEDDAGFEPRYLYSSAPSLFASMKGSMHKCADFSTHNTMFDIFQSFRKVVSRYCERLERLLGSGAAPLDSAGVEAVCCVYGTADYCFETLPQFCNTLQRVISSDFQERVTFENEQELLRNLMNNANKTLVQSVNCSLDDAFSKMKSNKWATFYQDVGDHSAYVSDIAESLSKHFEPVARHLSKIHFRAFCDKFVQAFVQRFIEEIYKCGKISEQGAQQLLLDTALLKTTLLEAPVIAGKGQQMPTAYSNYVLREMGRAETKLKVLTSPDIVDAAAVGMLLGSDGTSPEAAAEIERLLALRAANDGEPGNLYGSPREDEYGGNSGVAALGSIGDVFNTQGMKDMKKLSGAVNKNLQKLGSLGFNLPGIKNRPSGSNAP